MPDSHERSAAERDAARRERENRRARRAGRPAPYEQHAADFAEDPPVFDSPAPSAPEPEPAPAPPAAEPEPPVRAAASEPAPPTPLVADESDPPTAEHEPALPEAEPQSPAPQASEPQPPEPLVEPRDAPQRPIKSFPSPPDPEFYVPDDELETPSGTRRGARVGSRGGGGPSRTRGGRPPRPPRRGGPRVGGPASRPRRWWPRVLALVVLLLVAAVVVFAIEIFQPFKSSSHTPVTVRIPPNTGSDSVGRILARDGVISSSFFFELRATLEGDRGKIRAGTYHLHRGMSYGAVLTTLTRVPKQAPTAQLTIADGHTRQYVAALLRKQHVQGSYLAATVRSPLLDPRTYGAPRSTKNLEGFLFPDTFTLTKPVQAGKLVADQLKDFKTRFATLDLAQARRRHLSPYQVITIASLIEAESASPRDDRLVSSVIENRLRDHMMLQLDSTARYATGNFTGALTTRQLQSKSPYNTHTHLGLPPGPIDSPGLTALNAAALPSSSSYLYFFSKPCSNQTVFANSYAQFQLLLQRDYRPHCPH